MRPSTEPWQKRKSPHLKALIYTLLITLLTNQPAAADSIVQKLDAARSTVAFSISSGSLNVTGRFLKYSGELQLDPVHIENSRVRLEADASAVEFTDSSPLAGFNQMLQSMPPRPVTFSSTEIKSLGKGRYQVSGIVAEKLHSYPISTPPFTGQVAKEKSVISAKLQGSVLRAALNLPMLQGLGDSVSGTMTVTLVFQASGARQPHLSPAQIARH